MCFQEIVTDNFAALGTCFQEIAKDNFAALKSTEGSAALKATVAWLLEWSYKNKLHCVLKKKKVSHFECVDEWSCTLLVGSFV